MESQLQFTTMMLEKSAFGPETTVPDLIPAGNVQNKTKYELDDTDEIYEGYGKLPTAYPYRQRSLYTHETAPGMVSAAVLENDYLRAEFLPDYGGRLWRLYDKTAHKELLYTNQALYASNLAVRGAWFAGGVEWNLGVIGHTPLTTEPLFTASLVMPDGTPVLRMYEYERIRGVVYQMDFWLDTLSPILYAAMRVTNPTAKVTPMYWWSNIAVPQYENGRILVPAQEAYTSTPETVSKVAVPMVDGIDISRYGTIPGQVDYFFHIPQDAPKFIANVDEQGRGLLHASTARLQSRKLFSWGNNDASDRWQEFLTAGGAPYLEIQGGLGKTQYGCIPMAPHTTWDWVETYSPLQLSAEEQAADFTQASASLAGRIAQYSSLFATAQETARKFALLPATVHSTGSGYAALENALREKNGLPPMTPHLDFTSADTRQTEWHFLLKNGYLPEPPESGAPGDFMCGLSWLGELQHAAARPDAGWYTFYQLGLVLWNEERFSLAKALLTKAAQMDENPWTLHGLAAALLKEGEKEKAAQLMTRGALLRLTDTTYVKEAARILVQCGAWELLAGVLAELPQQLAEEARMRLYRAETLLHLGNAQAAHDILYADGGIEVPDLREGEVSLDALWRAVHLALGGEETEPVPHQFHFDALLHPEKKDA